MPLDLSNIYDNRRYKYGCEKRKKKRFKFHLEIFYPRINNESVNNYIDDQNTPMLEAIDISETGICFKSKLLMKKGDFLSFLMKIEDMPSFWCLAVTRWSAINDSEFICGLEFLCLSMEQILCIRNYTENMNATEIPGN